MNVPEHHPIVERIVSNFNFVLTFVLAALIETSFLFAAFFIGSTIEDKIVSISVLFFGFAVGSIIGTAASPYDSKEDKRFATYWKAIALFASGYAASKLDGALSAAFSVDALTNLTALTSFRLLGFSAVLLLTAKVTFACRSYHSD